jgi:hypothetical protein
VRADDDEVLVTLWNMRITTSCPVKDQTIAFRGFREFGWHVFLRAISTDCRDILCEEFEPDWTEAPRMQNDKLTKLGWHMQGIRNLIWHVDHTNFFEYKFSSKTYYFHFPIFYRKMVRDGCPIFMEAAGPELPPKELKTT